MNNNENKKSWGIIAFVVFLVLIFSGIFDDFTEDISHIASSDNVFRIIASTENKDLEPVILQYARNNNIKVSVDYAGTIEIMEKLNGGDKYDAVWTSNSIWLYMLGDNVSVKNSKSTSINPVVFGITKSKAQELGFIGKEVYTRDIVRAIEERKTKI